MKKSGVRLAIGFIWLTLLFPIIGRAQSPPPLTDYQLEFWSFDNTNWLPSGGYSPISFTNLLNPSDWDGNALRIDSTNAAWLQYHIVETGGMTNLTFNNGTIEFWFAPDWNSGTGLGVWGRLIEVGEDSTNNPSSWWSLYLNPQGTNIIFSSETNGVFTNYLCAPLTLTSNTWHLIDLTYSSSQSAFYLDGQFVTNGIGVNFQTSTNSFFIGSDLTGTQQARGQFDDMVTFNYALSASEIGYDYTNGYDYMHGITPPSGGGDTNGDTPPNYGSNLWMAVSGIVSNTIPLLLSNTPADVLLEIQGRTNLTSGNWFSLGFVNGSELTNWTEANVPVAKTNNLFLRIRSWQDTTGTQIPDWWWLTYFGQATNVDGYAADPAGDGFTDLQKYQFGVNPTNYYNPNALAGFVGSLDASGTNVVLEWNASVGPVTYSIQRGIQGTNGNYTFAQIGTVSSNATFFADKGVTTNANWQNNIYNIEASYPNAGVEATNSWMVWWYVDDGIYGLPFGPSQPNNFYAYSDTTNVFLSWTPAIGSATNYIIERGIDNTNTSSYTFTAIANVSVTATNYEVANVMTNGNWSDEYSIIAVYPGGGLAQPAYAEISAGGGTTNDPAAPTGIYGYADGTGTNLYITWNPSAGAVKYLVYGESFNYDSPSQNPYVYTLLGSTTTTNFEEVGGFTGGYAAYGFYEIVAVYANGSQSQGGLLYPSEGGISAPTALFANVDRTGTNVVLTWPPVSGATGYIVQRDDYGFSGDGYYYPIATNAVANATYYVDTNEVNSFYYAYAQSYGGIGYGVQATFPHGGISSAVYTNVSTNLPSIYNLIVTTDNTNAFISWNPLPGVSQYVITRGIYNPTNGTYTYTQIATVSGSTLSYEDANAISSPNSYNDVYQVVADYLGGSTSSPVAGNLYNYTPPITAGTNVNVSAQLVRNEQGHWQIIFTSIPANVQSIALTWDWWEYFYDSGPYTQSPSLGYPYGITTLIPVGSLTNNIYVLPDSMTVPVTANGIQFGSSGWNYGGGGENDANGGVVMIQPVTADGLYGNQSMLGIISFDEPAFADGREELKQNLLFELRAASISQPNLPFYSPGSTNYVESGFLHYVVASKGYGVAGDDDMVAIFLALDDLWPFEANYSLYANLYDPSYPARPVNFTWSGTLTETPAPSVLDLSDPYWIWATGIAQGINPDNGQPTGSFTSGNLPDLGASTDGSNLYLSSGVHNAFGLQFENAMVNPGSVEYVDPVTGYPTTPPNGIWVTNPIVELPVGGSVSLTNANSFYTQTADPSLQFTNYYFSPVSTPGTTVNNENPQLLYYPIPPWPGFSPTNQTGVMIASVGQPTVIGGWAKFGIANGSSSKFAYLGQYFNTNAYAVSNGVAITSTNKLGVVSPYGDFFPMQGGQAALVTMPDPDSEYAQGTGVVDVISLNVDANHDGTMDFSYTGQDFVSSSKPFRFWVNDVDDGGDDGGDGIPGGNGSQPDGTVLNGDGNYLIQGSRNLVNFFPVYLNIGSLFQSNVLSAGISAADTNYQFVLSQADGALRFAYTDLTPTNYMNFLQDTNEVFDYLHDTSLTTVSNLNSGGVLVANYFLSQISGNHGGIILMEAWTNTTQPLVLTIYHGTNQIAQTSLPLSITGVEQMFRSKTILLHDEDGTMPDRLTDADVPNEPDTTDMNFIFVHGYNVNPQQARGWDADYYKRLYWSGSHAKFYGLTWEAADSQVAGQVTINLQTNIVNAFNTAPLLNTFLNTLSGTNVVTAHSLGNMLVLATLNDYSNQNINTYCMVDAAVAIEAIDSTASQNPDMYPTVWTNYESSLWASKWFNLWSTNDARNKLTWSGRLANLQNANVYNFYSSGEEVLRDYSSDPPTNLTSIAIGQLVSIWEGDTGEYTWAWQEKLKGRMLFNSLLSSDHGGWSFNLGYYTYYEDGAPPTLMPPSNAASLPNSELQTNAFFDFTSEYNGVGIFTADLALYGSGGGSYAQTNRNRILSDAIPCLTLPIGANAVPRLQPPESPVQKNFDMQTTYENGWPAGRVPVNYPLGTTAAGEWHHSDNRAVAYTFTYPFFNKLVTVGNLK